ncbi:hypothetical protein BDQ12DRAFT_692899 [Crucibulum laeve]|uniref:Uncharacterized protein n=1 Tax=Crucibulum laeve TaxID=68775 RepID=A0A5C3LIX9_9AGAR|nr:hypothetical protein BDQ12DRAFT_692899 [Crucibulum laeve]
MYASPLMPISRAASPSPSGMSRSPDLPFHRSPSVSDFQIEKAPRSASAAARRSMPAAEPAYHDELLYRESVSRLIQIKDRQFAVSGRIPVDPSQLVLFFRSKSGITHSLDFPIDVDYNTPPALDVLIAACRPHQTADLDDYSDRESLFYPPNLPLTPSLEIASHPILDAVRASLFPNLPAGHHLTVMRDKLEVIVNGGRMGRQPPSLRNDGRSATIVVTLPVRFRGGALVVRDPIGNEDKFYGRGGKTGDIDWTAFLADCDYEIETVQKGCRLSIAYGVYLKTFGPIGVNPDPLISPSDNFFDLMAPILNLSRGRKIAFYINHDYNVSPSEAVADTLVPLLKGGDSLLYHAFKMYKLAPELHWTAGGYIWPVDRIVEFFGEDIVAKSPTQGGRMPFGVVNGSRTGTPAVRGAFGAYGGGFQDVEVDAVRSYVEASGAVSLAEADITLLTDWTNPTPVVGKERVPFVAAGELEKLVVNALLVVYIP